ncbi:MAG: hypothetical protein FVQ77_08830 [Cytophagales bacterium]|nr:hypothetical protein [Cytophagales bacterium]
MDKKIKLEILGLSSSQSQTGSFALVLGEEGGNRRLPIIIGMFEAQAIAIEMEKITPSRPMTHDLFKSFALKFKFSIEEIVIANLKEGIFFAKIVCANGKKTFDIDARPSDAIAIGLRFNVPIYTFEEILSEAGIILSEEPESEQGEFSERKIRKAQPPRVKDLKDMTAEQLKALLNDAVKKEDYENAARVRDELSKRN